MYKKSMETHWRQHVSGKFLGISITDFFTLDVKGFCNMSHQYSVGLYQILNYRQNIGN